MHIVGIHIPEDAVFERIQPAAFPILSVYQDRITVLPAYAGDYLSPWGLAKRQAGTVVDADHIADRALDKQG